MFHANPPAERFFSRESVTCTCSSGEFLTSLIHAKSGAGVVFFFNVCAVCIGKSYNSVVPGFYGSYSCRPGYQLSGSCSAEDRAGWSWCGLLLLVLLLLLVVVVLLLLLLVVVVVLLLLLLVVVVVVVVVVVLLLLLRRRLLLDEQQQRQRVPHTCRRG
jgi:hypothetical protein